MEVIFIKDLKNQGKAGQIKNVKDGYAQNYLIKTGYAVAKTKENLAKLEHDNKKKKEMDLQNKKIAEELKAEGYKIEKSQIDSSKQISSLGFHNVDINLYAGIVATIKVHLVKWGR